jgi:hypothetical protein
MSVRLYPRLHWQPSFFLHPLNAVEHWCMLFIQTNLTALRFYAPVYAGESSL